MDNNELKHEFAIDIKFHCRSCLSVGRRLRPLEGLADIYKKITPECVYPSQELIECLQVCWECYSLLKKVLLFQEQVVRANELLQTNQSFILASLSNLISVTINDTHETIYIDVTRDDSSDITMNINTGITKNPVNEHLHDQQHLEIKYKDDIGADKEIENIKTYNVRDNIINPLTDDLHVRKVKNDESDTLIDSEDIKTNVNRDKVKTAMTKDLNTKTCEIDAMKSSTDDSDSNKYNSDNDTEDKVDKIVKDKNSFKSQWAIKKAVENKKPKFRILTNCDATFIKVQISNDELMECIERDRYSGYYKSKRFKCDNCILIFSNQYNLMKHKEKYHPINNCTGNIDVKVTNKRHLFSHPFAYKCVICRFICKTRGFMAWHFEKEHKRIFQCLKCNALIRSRREFYQHFKSLHEKFICDYCGVTFKMRYCIENHIKKKHSPFECKPCNKRFARYNGLWLHNKLAHRPASPAYCVECDKQYKDVYRLKWHLCNSVIHTPRNKRRIPCPSCDKIFSKNIYMKDHYNLVHLKVFKYRCDVCHKNFSRNADLVKHKRKIHEGIQPPKNKICNMCGRGFATNEILQNHVRTHTGERPFVCSLCDARFSQRVALRAHARAKHDS